MALGTAVLAMATVVSGCGPSKKEASAPQLPPVQWRSSELAQNEKDLATAYTCTIDAKSLDAVAPMADADKHLFFPGYVDVSLTLTPTETGKSVLSKYADSLTVTTLSDRSNADDKDNADAPLFTTLPFDTILPEDATIQVTQDDYKNQVFTVNPDGTAELKSHSQYTYDDKGETKDKQISIIQEVYTNDEVNTYVTRGRVACGSMYFDKDKGWKLNDAPIANPVTVTDHATPLNQRPVVITLGK